MAVSEILIEIKIEPLEEGGYLATSDELQGLLAQGRTVAETMEIAQDVARKLISSYIEHNDPLPEALQAALGTPGGPQVTRIAVGVEAA
mgnify:FL=1